MAWDLPIWSGVPREGVRVLEPWDLWKNGPPGVMVGALEGGWRPPGRLGGQEQGTRVHSYHEPGAIPSVLCLWGRGSIPGGPLYKTGMLIPSSSQGCEHHMSYRKMFVINITEKGLGRERKETTFCCKEAKSLRFFFF